MLYTAVDDAVVTAFFYIIFFDPRNLTKSRGVLKIRPGSNFKYEHTRASQFSLWNNPCGATLGYQ
jgi:hypothetical protein